MIGETISHYKIIEKLGEGGMGVVYKAEDTKLERTVALKFLSPHMLGTEEEKIRFVREAKAAAALDHPSICTVHEIDEADGQTFIAMAYLYGQSLAERIESGPLDLGEALNIALRVAEGLKHAHQRGIVHRDIKPANIMVTEDGQARIMDFGLAKLIGRTRLTKTATVMGTVSYMSPEQARGDSAIDHRADVWSLGVLIYEMMTGALPFAAETDTGLIYKIVHEDPEPITNHRSNIPGPLVSIVEKAMQKDSQSRYEDAEELITDLESVKSGASVSTESSCPSIAVLPFVNMSADPEQEYFCDGLAEELINALTHIQDLKVIARTSAFSFKGKNVNVREIGRELDVGMILEGSVRKAGNKVRITAQLIDTAKGHHLWSERYDRPMDDIFAIQDEITQIIVDILKPTLMGGEKERLIKRQPIDLEAYRLYLKGRWFWDKLTEKGLMKAVEFFELAIEKDPGYAPAYAGLADSYCTLPLTCSFPPKQAYPKAREAALKAIEIDDTLAEAHASLAHIMFRYDWDWHAAEEGYKQAIDLNPGSASAHYLYSSFLKYTSRLEESMREITRALELDPLSLQKNADAALAQCYAGKLDQAVEDARKTIEMDPNYSYAHAILGYIYLTGLMIDESLAELEKCRDLSKIEIMPLAEIGIGIIFALKGKADEARQILDSFIKQAEDQYFPSYYIAAMYFVLGDVDEGFSWLEKAYEERDYFMVNLRTERTLAALGLDSDPRYIALLRKMNFPT